MPKTRTIADYRHNAAQDQEPDPQPGNYYVSVRDGERSGLLLGPFANDHATALRWIDPVRRKAETLNDRAHWYGFGTARATPPYDKPGLLNELFPEAFKKGEGGKP